MTQPLDSRKTKIIATLGPATQTGDTIGALIRAGVDVVRLNLSHGTLDEHDRAISAVRSASQRLGLPVAVLLDLQGPRIRTGLLKDKSVELKTGGKVSITADDVPGDKNVISTTYGGLYKDVKPGDRVLIDDGLIELKVTGISGKMIDCGVIFGGLLGEHKGMNLPGVNITAPFLRGKDVEDIRFGVERNVDYIALSFVRSASDVFEAKERIRELGAEVPVIAKIEKAEALQNLDAIIEEAEGIMIARGDLGVEISPEEIPVLQKKIISKVNEAGKIVITATQMLESMIKNPRPTRAEASDVANAVFDGTDALMLSGETAVGSDPAGAVMMMAKIAREAEEAAITHKHMLRRKDGNPGSFAQAVAFAAAAAASEVKTKAIVVFTQTGETAGVLSKLRPEQTIIAFTPLEKTQRRLSLVWGVRPFAIEFGGHTDEMICRGEAALLNHGIAGWGDTIVIVSGTRVGMRGATNMMKIDWIGSEECKLYLRQKGEE
jgi:pyruvate kinase